MECKMQKNYGATLMELLVVITIIAILVAVGYPSYQTYLMESRRSDAINALRQNQLIIENYMQSNGGVTPDAGDVTLLTTSPEGFYTLTYSQQANNAYKLVATAVNGTSQEDDTDCVTITLISQMDNIYPTYCH